MSHKLFVQLQRLFFKLNEEVEMLARMLTCIVQNSMKLLPKNSCVLFGYIKNSLPMSEKRRNLENGSSQNCPKTYESWTKFMRCSIMNTLNSAFSNLNFAVPSVLSTAILSLTLRFCNRCILMLYTVIDIYSDA